MKHAEPFTPVKMVQPHLSKSNAPFRDQVRSFHDAGALDDEGVGPDEQRYPPQVARPGVGLDGTLELPRLEAGWHRKHEEICGGCADGSFVPKTSTF